MKKGYKISIAIVIAAAVIAVIFWFSMPSEQRHMISFMTLNGDSYDNYQEYQVIDRNDKALVPTSFEPDVADTIAGNNNRNVVAITEMVKNENSKMMKKAMVQATGIDDYTGWHLIADEGAKKGANPFGPSPLSYYTSGLAANLHTQILKAAEVKGVELDNVKVEILNKFRWNEMMSPEGAGFLDVTTTNIIIKSKVSKELIGEIKKMALNSWTAGEAIRNETVIEPTLIVNNNDFEDYHATSGTTLSEISIVDGLKLSSITKVSIKPEYLKPVVKDEGDIGFDALANMEFEIFAISESTENSDRPYLNKITLSTPSSETWEIYADEFMGANDRPVAPTSLEYFTAGTALCLTSQTTLVSAMMGLDYNDYRIENQMDYRQEAIDSTNMASYTDTVHSYIIIESNESQERLKTFYNKSLSLCFAGEGLKNATDMNTNCYLNGELVK
ncbi:OsmC family protein [Maribacter polysiphoniae]|uniref:OsmC family protein n=1 Tax=Maribacter polysiphoniae TaxID=429344 RepID=A0A316DVG7_9FLAO|nr:OsmC family protein [Maribacter polysiphoniae]MBD1262056.1 OsmC family protein [Maribacter polysiphoniae]PWK21746.1 OsmC-like protein [Maribacter polysiphoniae]